MSKATFKAIVRAGGSMVAAMAAVIDGKARFFIRQKRESEDLFVGRISSWVKDQGGEALEMQNPEVLPDGVEVGEVLMRLKRSLGVNKQPDQAEYDVQNVDLVWSGAQHGAGNN